MSDMIAPPDPRDPTAPYPAVVGAPSEDGPIIYPPHQPGDDENVVPFQKETGLDPSKLPSLKEALGPKLRLLPGGAGGPNPPALPQNNPQSLPSTAAIVAGRQPRFAAAPPEDKKPEGMSTATVAMLSIGAAVLGYFIGKAQAKSTFNGPLAVNMEEGEE